MAHRVVLISEAPLHPIRGPRVTDDRNSPRTGSPNWRNNREEVKIAGYLNWTEWRTVMSVKVV